MSSDREKKIADAAVQAAKELLDSVPDEEKHVYGREVLTGKEAKEKFKADDEFAAKTVERMVKLKMDTLKRREKETKPI